MENRYYKKKQHVINGGNNLSELAVEIKHMGHPYSFTTIYSILLDAWLWSKTHPNRKEQLTIKEWRY